MLPGTDTQQLTTYLGWLMHRTRGFVVAGLLNGIQVAVAAIMLQAMYRTGSKILKNLVK